MSFLGLHLKHRKKSSIRGRDDKNWQKLLTPYPNDCDSFHFCLGSMRFKTLNPWSSRTGLIPTEGPTAVTQQNTTVVFNYCYLAIDVKTHGALFHHPQLGLIHCHEETPKLGANIAVSCHEFLEEQEKVLNKSRQTPHGWVCFKGHDRNATNLVKTSLYLAKSFWEGRKRCWYWPTFGNLKWRRRKQSWK